MTTVVVSKVELGLLLIEEVDDEEDRELDPELELLD
jgi:hypothetical protein